MLSLKSEKAIHKFLWKLFGGGGGYQFWLLLRGFLFDSYQKLSQPLYQQGFPV